MEKKKKLIDILREKGNTAVRQVSLFDLYDIADIIIKVRKKDDK